ncbi:MAG: hypothetical protein FJ399_00920 [Verrucomicrobia bacterium]|nr:hypothetical protein [Verrucomicrobiota bacterium]
MRSAWRNLFAAGSAALLAGCAGVEVLDPVHRGPYFVPKNHRGEATLGGIRRVVLLPVCGGRLAPPEVGAAFDPIFASALQGENRFEVVNLVRDECLRRFRVPEFSSSAALPAGLLGQLQEEFAADAVLFVDITVFEAYRPLALGLRAKLAAIDGSRLIWTFDEVFAADDAKVANAARRHYLRGDRNEQPLDPTPGVLQSPGRFAGYAAAAMFATLPPVARPASPGRKAGR